jgi:tetratricopeptide (TPR) repeat protein
MALLLLEQGKASEAHAYAAKSVAIDPKNSESHNFLGRALLGKKEYAEALKQFEVGLAIQSSDAALHYGRAAALEKLNRTSDAAISLRFAVQMAPEADSLVQVAELDRDLRRVDDALKGCRRALKRDPNHLAGHFLMARILTEEGRLEEAVPHWTCAKELGVDSVDLSVTKARALLAAGLFDEGIGEFRTAISTNPKRYEPYNGIVSAKRIKEEDRDLVLQMHQLVQAPNASVQDRLYLHYALGKAHDNLGEFETAIRHFDEANRLKRCETDQIPLFNASELREETDGKIRTITLTLFKRLRNTASKSDKPIFVVGMMRSGTTLAEQILSCHPEIGGAGEQPFWREWEPQLASWHTGQVQEAGLRPLADQFCSLLDTISPNKRYVVDKNPANCMIAGLLHLAFPNARIIHTIRHPVDTALSIWMTQMQTVAPFVCDRDNIVFAYREYERLARHWRSVMPADRYLEIRYEDLVLDSERVTRQMVDFCGLGWDEACLHPEDNLRAVRTPSFWQVRQPLYTTSIDRWRNYEPWLGSFRDLLP